MPRIESVGVLLLSKDEAGFWDNYLRNEDECRRYLVGLR